MNLSDDNGMAEWEGRGKGEGDIQAKGPACTMIWNVSYDMKDNLSEELLIAQCNWDMENVVGTSRRSNWRHRQDRDTLGQGCC